MIFNQIEIKNLRSFDNAKIKFGKINHLTGWNFDTEDGNGVGKTTVIQSLMLLLSSKLVDINLKKFIKLGEKSAKLTGIIEAKGDVLEIERTLRKTGTASFIVKVNGKDPKYNTPTDYQKLLSKYIGDIDNFKKFRLLDANSGVNILDFSSGQLRKTLMSLCQGKIDDIRLNLLNKKSMYEKFNKDLVLNKNYPSESRLTIIGNAIKELDTKKMNEIITKLSGYQKENNLLSSKRGGILRTKEIKSSQIQSLNQLGTCPKCFQKVSDQHKQSIEKELSKDFGKIIKEANKIAKKIGIYNDIIKCEEKKKTVIYDKKQRLNNLKYKLNTRISQKDYKYTQKDIETAKKAIEIVDDFANYYICEWIKIIEPLVNSYINKLDMELSFNANDKGKLEVLVIRKEKTFNYDQLSQGEKLFISVVFKIALLLERQENGLIIADESFDCLSESNLDRLMDIINELPIQLVFVTHKKDYNNLNANTIFIEKRDDVSKLRGKL